MPKTRGEDDKKHGDTLQSLIERAGGQPSARERTESDDEDESDLLPDDEDEALDEDDEEHEDDEDDEDEDDEDDDEDDEDEDVLNDDAEDLPDVGEPD